MRAITTYVGVDSAPFRRFPGCAGLHALIWTLAALCLIAVPAASAQQSVPEVTGARLQALADRFAPADDADLAVRLNSPDARYIDGDRFALNVSTTAGNRLLFLDYYQLDGYVVHIVPSLAITENRLRPDRPLSVGESPDGPQYTVQPPFGRELIVAISSTVPIYEGFRREFEPATAYIDFLESALAGIVEGGGRVAVRLQAIVTSEAPPSAESQQLTAQQPAVITVPTIEVAPEDPPAVAAAPATVAVEPEASASRTEEAPAPAAPAEEAPQQTARVPEVEDTQSAAAADPAAEARKRLRDLYQTDVLPKLQQVINDPADEGNLADLSRSYSVYVVELARWGRFAEAKKKLQVAKVMVPESAELEEASTRISQILQAHESFLRGEQELEDGDLEAAYEALTSALEIEPGYPAAEMRLTADTASFVDFFAVQAAEAANSADNERALEYWRRVSHLAPDDEAAKAEVERLSQLMDRE